MKALIARIPLDILCGLAVGILAFLQSVFIFGERILVIGAATIPLLVFFSALLLRHQSRGSRILRGITALICYPAAVCLDHFQLYNEVYAHMSRSISEQDAGVGIGLVFLIIPGAWFLILLAILIAARLSKREKEPS